MKIEGIDRDRGRHRSRVSSLRRYRMRPPSSGSRPSSNGRTVLGTGENLFRKCLRQRPDEGRDQLFAQARYMPFENGRVDPIETLEWAHLR